MALFVPSDELICSWIPHQEVVDDISASPNTHRIIGCAGRRHDDVLTLRSMKRRVTLESDL